MKLRNVTAYSRKEPVTFSSLYNYKVFWIWVNTMQWDKVKNQLGFLSKNLTSLKSRPFNPIFMTNPELSPIKFTVPSTMPLALYFV